MTTKKKGVRAPLFIFGLLQLQPMRRIIILITFLPLALVTQVSAGAFPGFDVCNVTSVVDGDTFKVECEFRGSKTVRVVGIDAFETRRGRRLRRQAESEGISAKEGLSRGNKARECLQHLISGKRVILTLSDKRYDWFNRLLPDRIYFCFQNEFADLGQVMKEICKDGLAKR